MEAHEVLEQVKSGKMTVEEAEQFFKREPFEEMGYAKIDSHRKMRSGFAEVVFCQGKRDEFLLEIFHRIYKDEGEVMGTRASLAQYELLHKELPQVTYDPVSHILKIEKKDKKRSGLIAVCTAGTADIAVAEEAAQTAEFFGANVERIYDVGVSGIHRLLSRLEVIQKGQLCCCSGWHGRSTGKCFRRTGKQAGNRCTNLRRLWSEYGRHFCIAYHD